MKFRLPETAPNDAAEMFKEYVHVSPLALNTGSAQPLPGVWPTVQLVPSIALQETQSAPDIGLIEIGAGAQVPFCWATVAATVPTTPGPETCQVALFVPVLMLITLPKHAVVRAEAKANRKIIFIFDISPRTLIYHILGRIAHQMSNDRKRVPLALLSIAPHEDSLSRAGARPEPYLFWTV
jgi:hypothetical protein